MFKDFADFIRNINPKFVLLFPLLVLPAMVYYMVRPWILMDELVENNIFMGIPIYRPEAQKEFLKRQALKKVADEKEFAQRSEDTIRREAAERAAEADSERH